MKTRTIFLVVAMLALCRPAIADDCWQIDATRYLKFLETIPGFGSTQGLDPLSPEKYANEGDCKRAIQEYNDPAITKYAECVRCKGSGGNSGGSLEQQLAQSVGALISGGTGSSPEKKLAGSLAEIIVGSLFSKKQKPSTQDEIERQNAIKRQQEEAQKKEAARIAGNQAWIDLQNIEQEKRTFDDAKKLEAGKDLLDKMGTIDSGDLTFKIIGTDFFGTAKPSEVRLQSKGTGSHFTSDLKPVVVPDAPKPEPVNPEQVEASKQKLATLVSRFQKDVKFLLDIEIKLSNAKVQIKEAESKKEAAQIKLEEAKNIAATAKPEEKSQADDLVAQAQAALQSADGEIAQAKQSENDMIKEKEKIENDVKNINAEVQAEGKK